MCAINGIVDLRGRSVEEHVADDALVRRMNEATIHRGPDGSAVWSDTFATLGSNRLAILDLSTQANQPMVSASGRFTIAFNGEIYNFKELRAELHSYSFKTEGDTEVILAAFERWGTDAFVKLRGMFALALWDGERHELILARDHSGIKPLYYRYHRGRIAFSSELKGMLADKKIVRRIAPAALEAYVRMRYVPEPLSMIEGIHKLSPGSFAIVRGEEFHLTRFFEVPLSPVLLEPALTIEARIRELVDGAVSQELVSDRPIGLFLSGGLDSTIILDAATKAAGKIETFSLRFDVTEDEQQEKFNADADLALRSAHHYKANHHEVLFGEESFLEMLPDAMYSLDQPIANATALAQLFLAREARKHIVVALAGDGGDELFGGYPRYRLSRLMDLYQHLPTPLRALLSVSPQARKLDTPPGIERIKRFLFEKDAVLSRVIDANLITDVPAHTFDAHYLAPRGDTDFTRIFMDADRCSWLVDEALARTDTMTMSASLEARVPLLNADLVTYASRIPAPLCVGFFEGKKILRSAFKERLPAHVFEAKKRGFFSPTAKWLRRPQALAFTREVLSKGFHPPTDEMLNFAGVRTMLDDHVAGRHYALPTLWMLITLRLWARSFEAHL